MDQSSDPSVHPGIPLNLGVCGPNRRKHQRTEDVGNNPNSKRMHKDYTDKQGLPHQSQIANSGGRQRHYGGRSSRWNDPNETRGMSDQVKSQARASG